MLARIQLILGSYRLVGIEFELCARIQSKIESERRKRRRTRKIKEKKKIKKNQHKIQNLKYAK